MLDSLKLLSFFINIDQKTILNWFRSEALDSLPATFEGKNASFNDVSEQSDSAFSFETLILIIKNLTERVQNGLTLADIEAILFFLVFIRFVVLAFRYNLKTSFYITCIGLCAGYLWYRHLIDIILMYRQMLGKVPYLQKLGTSVIELESDNQVSLTTNSNLIYSAFIKSIIHIDSVTGKKYYIDPISMIISNLSDTNKVKVLPIYYKIYNTIIPQIFEKIGESWNQLSGIAAYAMITRVGKRYCPYLIRWHWTFLLIIGFVEQILIYFLYRLMYFQDVIIQGKLVATATKHSLDPSLVFQFDLLTAILICLTTLHVGSILFGLFHAICGQYFYFPFLVENTELHIGPRPKHSLYSGGQTAWQDEKQQNKTSRFPQLWYGWFGNGKDNNSLFSVWNQYIKSQLKKLLKMFRK